MQTDYEICNIKNMDEAKILLAKSFIKNRFINTILTNKTEKLINKYFDAVLFMWRNTNKKGIYINNKLVSLIIYESPNQKSIITLKEILYVFKKIGIYRGLRFVVIGSKVYSKAPKTEFYISFVCTVDDYKNKGLAKYLIEFISNQNNSIGLDIQGEDLMIFYNKFGFVKCNQVQVNKNFYTYFLTKEK